MNTNDQQDVSTGQRGDGELREALAWYGEQARLARLIHSEGDSGRHALAGDGGKRAQAALANHPLKVGERDDVTKALASASDALDELWHTHCKTDAAYGCVTDISKAFDVLKEAFAAPTPTEATPTETARPVGEDALREVGGSDWVRGLVEAARKLILRWENAPELPEEMETALASFEQAALPFFDGRAALASPTQQAPDQGGKRPPNRIGSDKPCFFVGSTGYDAECRTCGRYTADHERNDFECPWPATPKANTGEA